VFSILDKATRLCDGVSRRDLLRIGGLGTLGLSLPRLLRASTASTASLSDDPTFGRAKNVIYVWLQGGPPQHETFDPKPEAPAEIRGPFNPIHTNVPGIDFCELLPRTARIADKLAVVRSMFTDSDIHDVSGYEILTGYKYRGVNSRAISPSDWPYFGSVLKVLKPSERLPALTSVWIPQIMRLNENVTPAGQTGGFLGRQWDPDRFTGDPSRPDYHIEGLDNGEIPALRMKERVSLLAQVEDHFRKVERSRSVGVYDQYQNQAFDLLTGGKVRNAFAIQSEPDKLRDRYGRTQWGQCLLLARRLVEAGVRLVHVNWSREPGDSAVDNPMWDTHAQNADRVEDVLCPMFDVGFTALMEDLDQRGLLSETLVVVIGEFGRTPKINSVAGRDHWGHVFSFLLAGAGIQTGQVLGASDKSGGYPARDPVTPGDLSATVFHLLGVPHESTFQDAQGRPHFITPGSPIRRLLGSGPATDDRVAAGGDITRVPPYNDALLLNVAFTEGAPLRPTNLGSRPKGWRARPLAADASESALGAKLFPADAHFAREKPHVGVGYGFGVKSTSGMRIQKGESAILAQEMRNPRLGRFRFAVKVCGHASSRAEYEDNFLKHFTCRLLIYRYNRPTKDPAERTEFISLPFVPPFAELTSPMLQEFSVEKLLDSPGPGQNFPIGNGYGVAVVIEKTTDGVLDLTDATQFAWVRIDSVQLDFANRTINDKVQI
jgi:hypothetical protein